MHDCQKYYKTNLHEVQNILLDKKSKYLRSLIMRAILNGGRGHVGSALSMVETIRVLYESILNFRPNDPAWSERDRYILSKGHGCLAIYAQLADSGFFPKSDLDTFCKFDSSLGGHPEIGVPGIEASTGALGHGMAVGMGMALAARIKDRETKIFVHMGDGEINEGSVWESASAAAKHSLGSLNVIIDYNKLQSAGPVEEIQPMEPLIAKWSSFGFAVYECNGHDIADLLANFRKMSKINNKPKVLIAHTIKGKGIPIAESNPSWHHKSKLTAEEIELIEKALKVGENA